MRQTTKKFAGFLRTVLVLSFAGVMFSAVDAGVGMPAPEISGRNWLNSGPKRISELKGKVVLVEFCQRPTQSPELYHLEPGF